MKNSSRYFCNKECEYYPCHKNAGEDFNCLFCYCPLYSLGRDCGGNFRYLENGIKSCEDCTLPHDPKNYNYIIGKCSELVYMMMYPKRK